MLTAELSIVIPAFNEEVCLPRLLDSLGAALAKDLRECRTEVIIVDDHSTDGTPRLLEQLAASRPWLRHIRLLRNSGSHVAIFAGLSVCQGDAAYIMGADLQDPPDIIPEFIERRGEGFKIVLGERAGRDDPWWKIIPSKIFNFFMSRFVLKGFPVNGGDVFLLDRDIIDAVLRCNEKNVNIFVLMLSLCSDVGTVKYRRQERIAGQSKWTFRKLFKLALDSVITVGYLPLKMIMWIGLLAFTVAFVILIYILVAKLMGRIEVAGWASTMTLIAAFGGIQLVSIAVIGEYLWRNFDQTRQRPMFIIERSNIAAPGHRQNDSVS